MSVWEQVVAYMTRTYTPVESATQLAVYAFLMLLGVVVGWLLHKARSTRR